MNPFRLTLLAAAVVAGAPAFADDAVKFSGFGTVAAVHSSEKDADFVGSIFQPDGAGHTDGWSFKPDTKFGLQAAATLTPKLTATAQLVTQYRYDHSWTPQIEWANLKYQLTDALSLRVGRTALPTYMISESRMVGYANPWVRPPVEVYGVVPLTSNDGVDVSWRTALAGGNNTLHAYYGTMKADIPGAKVRTRPTWGIEETFQHGDLSLRANYMKVKMDLESDAVAPLMAGLAAYAAGAGGVPLPSAQASAAQASALLATYDLKHRPVSVLSLGAQYDNGSWFGMAEVVDFKGATFVLDSQSWYVSGGYRFGAFAPYVTFASTKVDRPHDTPIGATGVPALDANAAALNAGLALAHNRFAWSQDTVSVGVRWDVKPGVDVKAQFDRVKVGDASRGRFVNVQPGFTGGENVNVFSLAVDFVF